MSGEKNISVVPWYRPDQFQQVHKAIFSNDVTEKRWAVDQISVWETRCHPALPTGIEATVVISRAIIQDILHDSITSFCHDDDIRYIYSLALIRFINLTLELNQNAKLKLPLTLLAKKLGLPSWMVDLRNQATHSYCPSLPVLRAGADHAMKYLKRTFWEVEETRIQSYIRNVRDEETKVYELITAYKQYKYKELKEEVECTEEIKTVVDEMRGYLKSNRIRFVELLTYEGMFVFNEEELHYVLKGIDEGYLNDSEKVELPDVLEYFWDKVLHLIVRYDLIGDFAELLLLTQDSREPLSKKLAISWVFSIIRSVAHEKISSSIFVTLFKTYGVFIEWKRLLFACAKYPCLQTPVLFPIIISHLNMKQQEVSALMYLVAIFQGQAADKTKVLELSNYKMFTVEDAKRMQKLENQERKKRVPQENLWSTCPEDLDLSTVPIGAIFNPVEDSSKSTYENVEENNESFIINTTEGNAMDLMIKETDWENGDNEEEMTNDEDDDFDTKIEDDMIYSRKSKQ